MDSNLRFPDRSAPVFETASPVLHLGLAVSRPGTESSNPSPSTGESMANLTSSIRADILFLDSPLMEAEMREARSRVVPLPDKP